MLCSKCNKREANVFFSQNINGVTEEYHLCGECAGEMGLFDNSQELLNFGFGDMFSPVQIMNTFFGNSMHSPTNRKLVSNAECANCGMSYSDFAQNGRFGCPSCYDVFSSLLPTVFERFHGSSSHIGKVPHGQAGSEPENEKNTEKDKMRMDIGNLRNKLAEAVRAEEYENAAKIRDEIRKLESQLDN